MDRRHFLRVLLGAATGVALEQAIPFNRVWSFPRKIRIANLADQYKAGILGQSVEFDWHIDEIVQTVTTNVSEEVDRLAMKAGMLVINVGREWPYGLRNFTLDDVTKAVVNR